MLRKTLVLTLAVLAVAALGCRSRTDRSEGSVILSVTDFDGLPVQVSVSQGPYQIDQVTLTNFAKNPNATTTDLQTIELKSYEVRFRRKDAGTRVPPPSVLRIFGVVPDNGSTNLDNLPFLTSDQILTEPLRDLAEFGFDQETGTQVIVLDVSLRFFGETLAGDNVVSEPASFTIEVFP